MAVEPTWHVMVHVVSLLLVGNFGIQNIDVALKLILVLEKETG
jgi:hypothetical protein